MSYILRMAVIYAMFINGFLRETLLWTKMSIFSVCPDFLVTV